MYDASVRFARNPAELQEPAADRGSQRAREMMAFLGPIETAPRQRPPRLLREPGVNLPIRQKLPPCGADIVVSLLRGPGPGFVPSPPPTSLQALRQGGHNRSARNTARDRARDACSQTAERR